MAMKGSTAKFYDKSGSLIAYYAQTFAQGGFYTDESGTLWSFCNELIIGMNKAEENKKPLSVWGYGTTVALENNA